MTRDKYSEKIIPTMSVCPSVRSNQKLPIQHSAPSYNVVVMNNVVVMSNSSIPPPSLSAEKCKRLAEKVFPSVTDTGESRTISSLTGRSAMLPFTKKAFLIGELQPEKAENGQEEQVDIVINRKERRTVSTIDAKQWLLQSAVKNDVKSSPIQKVKSPSKNSSTSAPLDLHNMIEIQEEYSDDGTQIKGNTVDVSSQFRAIFGGNMSQTKPEEKEAENDSIMDETFEETPLKLLSDVEYNQLSDRLDELARLEDMEEERQEKTEKVKPNKGKKKVVSGGWNKGFLNKPSTKRNPTKPNTSKHIAMKKETLVATGSQSKQREVTKQAEGVSFDLTRNEIQKIPGIPGTRSIPKPSTVSNSSTTSESSFFSGVIQERPTTDQLLQQRAQDETCAATKPKKKLSRFAQERLMG